MPLINKKQRAHDRADRNRAAARPRTCVMSSAGMILRLANPVIALRRNLVFRQVGMLASGQIIAQLINFTLMPIVTRLYSAEDIGLQGLFTSALSLLVPLSTLGFHLAIVLPREDVEARKLMRISAGLALILTIILGFALMLFGERIFAWIGAPELTPYGILIPLAMMMGALIAAVTQYLVRRHAFAVMARVTVLNSATLQSSRIIAGMVSPSGLALIATYTFTNAVTLLLYLRRFRSFGKEDTAVPAARSATKLVADYRDFPLLRSPQNLINAFSQLAPIFLLSIYFGLHTSGQYSIAIALLSAPAFLVGQSINDVLYPKFNAMHHSGGRLQPAIIKATLTCMAAGFVPYAAIVLFGPQIFSLIYGAEWHLAGEYGQWLALWYFLQMANRPAVAAVPVLRLQGGLLIYELFSTGSKIAALWAGYRLFNDGKMSIALFAVAGILAYAILIAWVIVRSGSEDARSRGNDGAA
jgi:O-antigen/teichoic acid export membrane protein